MLKINIEKIRGWRQLLFLWMLLLPIISWAQSSGTYVTWDFQVACIDNNSEDPKEDPRNENSIVWEEIEDAPCIRVCENKTVNYTVHGSNITNVQWSVQGGALGTVGAQPAMSVPVTWGAAGNGGLNITITYANGTQQTESICFEKIYGPLPKIGIAGAGSTDVCINSTIYFENLTTNGGGSNVTHYLWDFGDGTTSTQFEPNHTYSQPGSYYVTLTATNECNCSQQTKKLLIKVSPQNPVTISCPSVVCEKSKETYTVSDTCPGKWKVIGGSFIVTGQNSIEVEWNNVDPADGFGYVMYQSKCGCPNWTTVKVPVILSNAKIQGSTKICTKKQYTYKLPQWPTTHVQWNVSDPSVQLEYTPHRNEVVVKANQAGTFTLYANYTNTLLGCGGKSEIVFTAEAPVEINNINTGNEICQGSSQTFTATPNIPVQWTISGQGSTYTSPLSSQPYTHTFSTPGTYVVTAVRPGGCGSVPKIVKVIATPSMPTGTIIGPDKVCAGVPYTYTLSSIDNGVIPVWEVTNGTVQGSNTGQSVTVVFNANASNYVVSVKNRTLDQIGCESTAKTYNVQKIDLTSITVTPSSPAGPYCPSTQQTFTANLNGIVPDSMEWSFSQSNFGSFVSGQGTNAITVNFNEISNNQDVADLILTVVKCGTAYPIPVQVKLKKSPVVTFANTNNICLGGNLQFTINVQGLQPGDTANVTFEINGYNVSAGSVSSNGNHTLSVPNNSYIVNNTGGNITQTVVVKLSGSAVCNYQPMASANFIVYPETKITISPTYNLEICDPNNYTPYTLYVNASSGLTQSTYFIWKRNGGIVAQGTNMTSYQIAGPNVFGNYIVEAQDVNGCTVQSQVIKVTQKCPTINCTVSPNPNLQVTANWTSCNTITANLTYTNAPSQIRWYINGTLAQNGGNTATFTTDLAGVNSIYAEGLYGNCWLGSDPAQVIKYYEPKFNFTQVCNANGTYSLTAHNTSTVFGGVPITYSFVLNSSGQPPIVGQSATFNNLAPGTYSVTLTLSSPGKPSCTITNQITLAPLPNVNFTWLPNLTQICSDQVIKLHIQGYSSVNTYQWLFDNTSFFAAGADTEITFNSPGPKQIRLKATTPQGCVYESNPVSFTIMKAQLFGELDPQLINVCEGTNIPNITFNNDPSYPIPVGFIWMNGNQPVAGATNSPSFTPTESGNYWPILVDASGCKTEVMAAGAVPVTIRKKPYVNIVGKANLCAGDGTTLYGVVTQPNMNWVWEHNGSTVSSGTGAITPLTTGILAVGTHTYSLTVTPPNDPTCGAIKQFVITVSTPPAAPTITKTVYCADPNANPPTQYYATLTASGPANGQYNWSNGMQGQTITVTHGGIYEVTYTAPSGCKVQKEIVVEPNLESLMWMFPTGCYDVCPRRGYIIGPRGDYNNHEWQLFGNAVQSGSGFISPYWPSQAGSYQLMINDGTCSYTSGTMTYTPDPTDCGIEYDCRIKVHIEAVRGEHSPFEVYGVIHNFGNQAMTLSLTSPNNNGVYYPSSITIPAGGSYDFMTNPILFYPVSGYQGGPDTLMLSGSGCNVKTEIEYPRNPNKGAMLVNTVKPNISIVPNPAKHEVKITYNTGNKERKASMVMVYDAMGNVKYRQKLDKAEGHVTFDVTPWLQGVYIVTIVTADQPIQAKMLKE